MTDTTSGVPPLSPRLEQLLKHTEWYAEMIRDTAIDHITAGDGGGAQPQLATFMGDPAQRETFEQITWWINAGEVHPPDRAAAVLTTVLVSGYFDVELAVFAFEAWYQQQSAKDKPPKMQRGDLSRLAEQGDKTVLTCAMALGFDVKGENYPHLSVIYRQPAAGETEWEKMVTLPGDKGSMEGHVTDIFLNACQAPHTIEGQLMKHLLPAKNRQEVIAFLMRQQMVSHAAIASNRDDLDLELGKNPSGIVAHDLFTTPAEKIVDSINGGDIDG